MRVSNVLGLFKSQKVSDAFSSFLKQNPSLEEVLNHESTPQEISQGNQQFSIYFTPSILYQLLDILIKDPEIITKNSFKFPFVASLFFCSEQVKLLHTFYKDENILLYLLKLLDSETEINPTVAGYFVKACDILIMINPERFLTVLFDNQLEQGLFRHLYTSSMAELLIKVFIFIGEFNQFIVGYLNLINQLMEMIRCQDLFVSTLASQVMQRVVLSNFDRLYSVYLNKEFLAQLLIGLQTHEGFIVNGKLKVLLTVLQKNGNRQDLVVVSALQVIIPALEDIIDSNFKALNETCIYVLEIIKYTCSLNNEICNSTLTQSQIFTKLLKLLEKYPWSSILHNNFLSIFRTILSINPFLTNFILNTVEIQNFILKFITNPYISMKKVPVRAGFIAHLFVLANDLTKLSQSNESVSNKLESTKGWKNFVSDILKWQNQIEAKQLGYSDNHFQEDSKSSEDLLSEEELKDFELIDEKTEEKEEKEEKEENFNYEIIEDPQNSLTENKENENIDVGSYCKDIKENCIFAVNNRDADQIIMVGNLIVERILLEATQELNEKFGDMERNEKFGDMELNEKFGDMEKNEKFRDMKLNEKLFTPVAFWKLRVNIGELEDL